jgi:hypothetical protein
VVDSWIVGKTEVETAQRPPGENGVVGDVLLVAVAVASEELGGGGNDLTRDQVRQLRPNDGLDTRSLLSVNIDVGKRGWVGELDEADVIVRNVLRPVQVRIRDQSRVVPRRVGPAGGGVFDDRLPGRSG